MSEHECPECGQVIKSGVVLMLNDMRSPKIEILRPVAWDRGPDALRELMDEYRCAPYSDGRWRKSFRKDSPLEWFNGPWGQDEAFQVAALSEIQGAGVPHVSELRGVQ